MLLLATNRLIRREWPNGQTRPHWKRIKIERYPAAYVPHQLTVNAQKSWAKIKGMGVGQGKKKPGPWTLAGPSTANFPDISDL